MKKIIIFFFFSRQSQTVGENQYITHSFSFLALLGLAFSLSFVILGILSLLDERPYYWAILFTN